MSEFVQGTPGPLGDLHRARRVDAREQEGEFVTAVAEHEVRVAAGSDQGSGDLAQVSVAGLVALSVVHIAEVIEVEHDQAERGPVTDHPVEALLELMTWRDPRRVLELARMAVAPRDGHPNAGPAYMAEHLPDLADRVAYLDGPRIRLSASELRQRVATGRTLRYLVPDAVAAYIGDHGLYRNPWRNDQS